MEELKEFVILCVDDDDGARRLLKVILEKHGFKALLAGSGYEALEMLKKDNVDLVISDQQMNGMDGLEFLRKTKKSKSDMPFIMVTGHGSVEKAVLSLKSGAVDYIQKPYDPSELVAVIRRSLDYSRLTKENRELKDYIGSIHGFQTIITKSPRMLRVLKLAEKVAKTPSTTVAIFGESGSGKEVLARAIHSASDRMKSRFVAVNCAGIPTGLLESELFGHVKGAFTGADKDREGKFDLAQGGTILLDEIGDMPLNLQAKLLRVLQERTYERVGSNKCVKADFRVIVATHRNLEELLRKGQFREDLYHRINAFPISIPPLRERKEDIHELSFHFLEWLRGELGKRLPGISQKAMDELISYDWPGNVRELKNCIERAAITIEDELIRPEHLILSNAHSGSSEDNVHPAGSGFAQESAGLSSICISLDDGELSLDSVIDRVLRTVLERCGNNKSHAAKLLKVDRRIFYRLK